MNFNPKNWRLENRSILGVILILACFLRLFTLGDYESWFDEKISVSEANGLFVFDFSKEEPFTLQQIQDANTLHNAWASTVQTDGANGMAYITLLHLWTVMFDNSDFAVRMLSLIFGLAVVLLSYYISMEIFANKTIAYGLAFLLAIHPQLITYSQEARTYMLTTFLTLWATLILLRLLKSNEWQPKNLVLYFCLAAAAALAHYSSVYIFTGHFFILIVLHSLTRKKWMQLFAYAMIPALVVCLWMYHYGLDGLRYVAERNQNYQQLSAADPRNAFYMKTSLSAVVAGWLQNLLAMSGNMLSNVGVQIRYNIVLLSIPLCLAFVYLFKFYKAQRRTQIMILILAASPLLFATLLALLAGHIISFQTTYSVFAIPYMMILILASAYFIHIRSSKTYLKNVTVVFGAIHILVMVTSSLVIYNGADSKTKSVNRYEAGAGQLFVLAKNAEDDLLRISYPNEEKAIEFNKYLGDDFLMTEQIIRNVSNDTLTHFEFRHGINYDAGF